MSFVSNSGLQYYHNKMKTLLAGKSDTSHTHNLNTMINTLGIGTSTPMDNDYYISQSVGGGQPTLIISEDLCPYYGIT